MTAAGESWWPGALLTFAAFGAVIIGLALALLAWGLRHIDRKIDRELAERDERLRRRLEDE